MAAEETVTTLQQQLPSAETAVQELQEGWKVNAAAMETNIKALDARMEVVKKQVHSNIHMLRLGIEYFTTVLYIHAFIIIIIVH
jgi:hypothetical protein